MTTDFETFVKRRDAGGPRNDIARLAGSRLVVSIEVDEGKQLAEGLVKMITGGYTVTARYLYHESFEYKPAFKLVLVTNHAPRVDPDDDAMWRRIHLIPMVLPSPAHSRDPKIKAHLRDPSLVGPAILQWLLKGCLDWQREGLKIPAVVQQATEDYRASQDSFADFISECCIEQPGACVSIKDLRDEYETWTSERGGSAANGGCLNAEAFATKLLALGLARKKGTAGVRGWSGIKLDSDKVEPNTAAKGGQSESVH